MKVVILTEGGQRTGFGHVTRCRALRDAFKAAGIPAMLVVNGDASVRGQFRGQLDLAFNWIKDSRRLFDLIRSAHTVVLDSYLAPLSLYKKIAAFVPVPVYIDDYARLPYPRGIVLNGAIGAEKFRYPKDLAIRYLCGAKYALLRKEFWRTSSRKVRKEIKEVLVSFGGIRRSDFVRRLLTHLSKAFPQWRFHVVLPKDSGSFISRRNVCIYYGVNAAKMRSLMRRSDIAISGGGQTTNELSACGLPVIGICFAENQRLNIQGWQEHGVLKYAGPADRSDIFRHIEFLIKSLNYQRRCGMSASGRKLIDGKGALRIAKELSLSSLALNSVDSRDRRQIFLWSNDPQVRAASFRPRRIGWAEHCSWFGKRVRISQNPFYKILWLGRPAGQIRFDRNGNGSKISVSVGRLFRGKGIGTPAIRLAAQKFFKETGVPVVDAFVKSRNGASFKAFSKAGFLPVGMTSIEGNKAYHLKLRKGNDV